MWTAKLAALAALLCFGANAVAQDNVFKNGGFEMETDAWLATSEFGRFHLYSKDSFFTGNHGVRARCVQTCDLANYSLSQLLDTTPGQIYDLTFFSRLESLWGVPSAHISIRWNGASVAEIDQARGLFVRHDIAGLLATGETTTFELIATMNVDTPIANSASMSFDDFSTAPSLSAVPEPGSASMALAGLAALAFAVRRRTRHGVQASSA